MQHIIWDLDGTLIDSQYEVLKALEESILHAGLSMNVLLKELKVGPTIDIILKESFPENLLTKEKQDIIITKFREQYDNSDFSKTFAFEGIDTILCKKNYMHHIVTNKPDYPTKRILKKLEWNNFFETILTPYSDGKIKNSKTELIGNLVKHYSNNDMFISIGDMASDCKASKENDILFIGVLWGSGTKKEFQDCNADYIVETVDELKKLINTIL